MRSIAVALFVTFTFACNIDEAEDGEALGEETQALSAYVANPYGTLSTLAEETTSWTTLEGRGIYRAVPGLAGAVYSRAGDNLAITVSIEMQATSAVSLRALVDGQPAGPDEVVFKNGSTLNDGTRTFTFVKPVVSEGQHVVVIEARSGDTANVTVRRRSLALTSAAAAWGSGRLAVASAETTVTKTTNTWEDVPGMITYALTPSSRELVVGFSAYAIADAGRLHVRALVNGVPQNDTVLAEAGDSTRGGARMFQFEKYVTGAGSYPVKIQWRVEGGSARLLARSLTVEHANTGPRGGAFASSSEPAATAVTSTSFVPLGNGYSFTTVPGSSSVQILWTGEARMATGSGQLKARVRLDGQVMNPAEVTLLRGGSRWRTVGALFTLHNVAAGSHSLGIDVAVDSGNTAYIGDRTFRVQHKERHGSELVEPMKSMAPADSQYNALVICMDPMRPSHPRPANADIRNYFQGPDGGLSLEDWLAENSAGRGTLGAVMYRGCTDGAWYTPPAAHQGTWYWEGGDDEDRFAIMRQDALAAADADFDFHTWDFNHDNALTKEELTVYYVIPQTSPYGAVRTATAVLDTAGSTPMRVRGVDSYLTPAAFSSRRRNVSLLAHETSHAFFGALDLYCGGGDPQHAPARYSVMDDNYSGTHLDPFHKLKMGFVTPDLIDIPRWFTANVSLLAVEAYSEVTVLYDPARADREYFILEHRANEGIYDSTLTSAVVVWHVFEDFDLGYDTRPADSDTYACGKASTAFRRAATLTQDGQVFLPTWSNGATTGLRLERLSRDATTATVEIMKLP